MNLATFLKHKIDFISKHKLLMLDNSPEGSLERIRETITRANDNIDKLSVEIGGETFNGSSVKKLTAPNAPRPRYEMMTASATMANGNLELEISYR